MLLLLLFLNNIIRKDRYLMASDDWMRMVDFRSRLRCIATGHIWIVLSDYMANCSTTNRRCYFLEHTSIVLLFSQLQFHRTFLLHFISIVYSHLQALIFSTIFDLSMTHRWLLLIISNMIIIRLIFLIALRIGKLLTIDYFMGIDFDLMVVLFLDIFGRLAEGGHIDSGLI